MRINHNLASLNTYRQLTGNTQATSKSLEKLSSGLRINRAGDDAAGLAISEKMRGQIRGLDQASRNGQDAISLIQTAEGALNETHSILQRMRELAVQSSTDTNTSDDRTKIQSEVDQLAKEITRISNTTEFNTQNLLAGGMNDTFHIGANAGQNINLTISAMDAKTLGVSSDTNVAGTFGAGTTTMTGNMVTGLGKGLTSGTYSISVTHSASTAATAGSTFTGAITVTAGSYTGARDATVVFKATAVNGAGSLQAAQYSTDGGVTWNAAAVTAGGLANSYISYQGQTLTVTSNAANAIGNQFTATLTAKKDAVTLKSGGAAIGAAVTLYSDMTTATIGDTTTGRTMTLTNVANKFANMVTGTSNNAATQGVTTLSSSAATFNPDGTIASQASAQGGIDVSSQSTANSAITTINTAITTVSAARSNLGAVQNRLEHTINNLGTSSENLTAAESRIRDVDMAKEMMEFTKNNILSQAAQSMLAQANQQPQGVLQLLR